jgi:DNA-binding NtrC family response regulator
MNQETVLVVEDDPLVRRTLRLILEAAGRRVVEASGLGEALNLFRSASPAAVLADHYLGDGSALDLLREVGRIDPRVPVVVITGNGSIELAVEAMKGGAHHFIAKPAPPSEIVRLIDEALASRRRSEEAEVLDPLLGESAAIRRAAVEVQRVLGTDGPVLLRGETGTGKTILARRIHERSPRSAGPLVTVNCAGLSREGCDAEIFGRERGAVPGAAAGKTGLVEAAAGGTLLLDEIGDLDPAIQAKLLTLVDERRIHRVGGIEERCVDLRVIVATQRDLERCVVEGTFRRDLFFRISRLPIVLPPLRDRLEDLPRLAEAILARGGSARTARPRLSQGAVARLLVHSWPGNLRELRNVLERAVLVADGLEIREDDLRLGGTGGSAPFHGATLTELERSEIEKVLFASGYRVPEAARRLGIPRSTLYQRVKEYGLALPRRASALTGPASPGATRRDPGTDPEGR